MFRSCWIIISATATVADTLPRGWLVQGGTSTMLDFADHLYTSSSVSVPCVLAPVRRVWFALLAGSMGAPEGFWICLALSPVALGWCRSERLGLPTSPHSTATQSGQWVRVVRLSRSAYGHLMPHSKPTVNTLLSGSDSPLSRVIKSH